MLNWVLGRRSKTPKKGAPRKPSYDEAKRIAAAGDTAERAQLAAFEDLEPEFLYYLARDEAAEVRRAVAVNEGTPLQADQILAVDADDEVRVDLARKIGRLVPTLTADQADRLTKMALEVLEVLARDDLPRVRATIADEIKHAANLPPRIVNRLARDIEEIVAAPILEFSPMLSDDDLLDILAGGVGGGALVAVSRRKDLGEKVSDVVARTLDVSAVASLLGNRSAQVREETLDLIAGEAEDVEEWHKPMVDRDHLPARVVRRIATFVSAALLDALIEKNKDQAEIVEAMRQTIRQRIERGDLAPEEPDWESAEERARRAFEAGELNDATIVEAVEASDFAFVRHALALMGGLGIDGVGSMLNTGSGKAITALAWHCGLSMDTALVLQQKVGKVQPRLQIRPGPDGRYAMNRDDMQWYIECVTG